MFILIYNAETGIPIRDGEVEQYVNAIIDIANDPLATTSLEMATENIIAGIRLAIKQQRLYKERIQIQFAQNGIIHPLEIDINGNFRDWPHGFCDTIDRYTEQLIDW